MLQDLLDCLSYSFLLSPIPDTFLPSHPPGFYWVLALFIQIYLASVEPFYTSLFLLHGIKINKARRNSPVLFKSTSFLLFSKP